VPRPVRFESQPHWRGEAKIMNSFVFSVSNVVSFRLGSVALKFPVFRLLAPAVILFPSAINKNIDFYRF
jgi:hypothetical protein